MADKFNPDLNIPVAVTFPYGDFKPAPSKFGDQFKLSVSFGGGKDLYTWYVWPKERDFLLWVAKQTGDNDGPDAIRKGTTWVVTKRQGKGKDEPDYWTVEHTRHAIEYSQKDPAFLSTTTPGQPAAPPAAGSGPPPPSESHPREIDPYTGPELIALMDLCLDRSVAIWKKRPKDASPGDIGATARSLFDALRENGVHLPEGKVQEIMATLKG